MELSRITMPNADPEFIDVLAEIVNRRLAGAESVATERGAGR